jgi:hypothetical protein
MADWGDLERELDVWLRDDTSATFWWRDDDAVRVTPALEKLLAISCENETPVALAVIPRDAEDALRDELARQPRATVLQHGWSHENHAPEGRQEEFGTHRPLPTMLDELARGRHRIFDFDRALPVFVPPWNRIDPHLLPHLPGVGLTAISSLGPRGAAEPYAGVRQTNVHVDIVDWPATRGFVGEERALDQVVTHLRQRREGTVDRNEPTGLMTHHAFHDDDCWRFVEQLVRRTRSHPSVRWVDAREAFWP